MTGQTKMTVTRICLILLLPVLTACTSDGNKHLLKDEVTAALKSCSFSNYEISNLEHKTQRQKRSGPNSYNYPRIDGNAAQETNKYDHERRDPIDMQNQTVKYILNASVTPVTTSNNKSENISNYGKKNNFTYESSSRYKRNGLFDKDDDQCLSQCIFAHLEVVDSKGIPREAELWNKVQSAVSSQQSRSVLKDQIRACFQELQSESEDNGCSYSNKLERCLMLHFADRKLDSKLEN